jgi:hypothetical protein
MATLTNWQKFDNAFKSVSAFIVLDQDTKETIAKIALKHPKDGAGRLYAFIHIIGMEIQQGYAGGYGYDKQTAGIINAAENCLVYVTTNENCNVNKKQLDFITLLSSTKAQSGWKEVINEKNGFIVIQVI